MWKILFVELFLAAFACAGARAGLMYPDPVGGWTYRYTGEAATAGTADDFDSLDGKPVHFLFLVANPPGMQLEYLLALSVLVRVVRDDKFRDDLLNCFDPVEIESRLSRAFRASMIRRGFPFN